jgi:peptidoglycan/xylan/chitin deacetylase (PgdA/CDA1 family)
VIFQPPPIGAVRIRDNLGRRPKPNVATVAPHTPRAGTRGVAHLVGAIRSIRPPNNRTVVLCYHSIGSGDSPLCLPAKDFRAQVELLIESGFDFVTFGRLADTLAGGSLPARATAVLTFDDGFADMHDVVWPILSELGVPASCFVTTGLMQGEPSVLESFGQLAQSRSERFLTPAQVVELARAGCEIGAHTHTHRNLMHLSAAETGRELGRSQAILEDLIGSDVRVLAYPFGVYGLHYTEHTARIARDLGFGGAAAVANRGVGRRDLGRTFQLPRFTPTREDTAWFRRRMLGDLDWVSSIRERLASSRRLLASPTETRGDDLALHT